MKPLVLTRHRRGGYWNEPTHRGFFLAGGCALYGPGEPLSVVPYARGRPLDEVVAAAGADCVIVNMKKRVVGWLNPDEVASLQVPTAIIEDDYHYEKSDAWYLKCRFDRIYFRGMPSVERSALDGSWLPFSVDPTVFRPGSNSEIDLGFCNTIAPARLYPVRNAVLNLGLPQLKRGFRLRPAAFVEFYRRSRIGVTCSSALRGENPKHILIPATGALLLTDGTRWLHELLPDPEMYELYTVETIRGIVERLLRDPEAIRQRGRLAAAHVHRHHTHAVRWARLAEELG